MKRCIGENSALLIFLALLLYLTDKVQGAGVAIPCVGGTIFKCTVNPCQIVSNTKVPNAVCRPDYCDGCNARFFLGNVDVTSKCGKGMPAVNCPPDKPRHICLLDPCQVTYCPKYHNARCRSDYCGGCKARFYDGNKEVTEECKANGGCPPGKPKVNCIVAPCQHAKCPAKPNAKCVDDYCGGCNARWYKGETEVTDRCSTGYVECPPDKPEVNCVVAPCRNAKCPAHPNAKCIDDYCGGCNVRWYKGKTEVTDTCSSGSSECPEDKPVVMCFVRPCQFAQCPKHPTAKCVDDYCGGCNARWYEGNIEVTKDCSGVVPDYLKCKYGRLVDGSNPVSCAPMVPNSCPAGFYCSGGPADQPGPCCLSKENNLCGKDDPYTVNGDAKPCMGPTGSRCLPQYVCKTDATNQVSVCCPIKKPGPVRPKPKCRYAKYFKDIGEEPTCRPDAVSCPPEYRCNTGRRGSLGYCCLKRNPCTKGRPWKKNGEVVHCLGLGAKRCPNRYECIGTTTSYSACCRMTVVRKCPKRRPDKKCDINLCKVTYCNNLPGARCLMDTCGKCKAKWIRNKKDVTKKCKTGCPAGKEVVPCFVDPCQFATCDAHPSAKCFSDYCGGCNARFFKNLQEVTNEC